MTDNGTYVLQTYGPEFRVAQLDGIEDLYEEMDTETMVWSPNVKKAFEAFQPSKIFADLTMAWDYANNLDDKKPTEYGVTLVTDFKQLKFDDLEEAYKNLPA
jgi:hypothetical protein